MIDHSLLSVDLSQDYFTLFGLTPVFAINLDALEKKFREIQSASHPDRFVTATSAEKLASMQLATFANTAYETLKHPAQRAHYFLQLQGIISLDDSNTAMPADFLMQQMEWREAIEDAKLAGDITSLDRLLISMQHEAKKLGEDITQLIDIEKNYDDAVDVVRKLVFMQKVCADLNQTIAILEDD